MHSSLLRFARNNRWLSLLLCLLPIVIYIWVFQVIALNVNYVAFDDIVILGIIPKFDNATLAERWQLLTSLFPEHRLVFSRSIILILNSIFGRINLVWPMIVANICWGLCVIVFYRAFLKLRVSVWYFVPIAWLWFNIQSFENIFWGVSSLCNFGVILFVLCALYYAVFEPRKIVAALLFAIAATFTYGNGLMVFPVIGLVYLLAGFRTQFFITLGTALLIALIYFIDFTPITQNLDFSNQVQVKEGFLGFFGFTGAIATITAYSIPLPMMYLAVATGMLLILAFLLLYKNQYLPLWNSTWKKSAYDNKMALFALSIAVFVVITALALTYKRIPTDTFAGMFKGRYRMYSTLSFIALYFGFLSIVKEKNRLKFSPAFLIASIVANLVILHGNFAGAVNNRRAAIVQEFDARYNADWLGIRMFSTTQAHFEQIRSYYRSADPLAEGWNPRSETDEIGCDSVASPDAITKWGDHILISFENPPVSITSDYSDGAYVILKSAEHVYASPANQQAVPLKTTVRRFMYFSKGIYGSFHEATVEPGIYKIYLLIRENGRNRFYCTEESWEEKK